MSIIKLAIVDDSAIIRKSAITFLSLQENMEVLIEAENGKSFLEQLKHRLVDIVLLDIQMPVMDGKETLLNLRKHYPHLKVIMHSFIADDIIVKEYKTLGAHAFVPKGNDPQMLLQVIRDLK